MLKNILSGYLNFFKSLLKIVALILSCLGIGYLVVYPLWKFATTHPDAYTVFVCSILAIILVTLIIVKSINFVKKSGDDKKEKKRRILCIVFLILRIAILIFGIVLFVNLVMNEKRLFGCISLIIAFLIYGVITFGTKSK